MTTAVHRLPDGTFTLATSAGRILADVVICGSYSEASRLVTPMLAIEAASSLSHAPRVMAVAG